MKSSLLYIMHVLHNETESTCFLLRRFDEAKIKGLSETVVLGTGKPRREILFADDLAEACVFLMENKDAKGVGEFINIGSGFDLPISEMAEIVREIVAYNGKLVYDHTKPDDIILKLMNVSRINALGWKAKTNLKEGIRIAYEDFKNGKTR